jgi:Restriction endonuclease AspBHI N-terminal/HNH endonuclease
MAPSRNITVGEVVRYPDPPNQAVEYLDGYRNFFHLSAVAGTSRLIMNRGIDNPAWVNAPEGPRRPVVLIRSNPLRSGTLKTPWEDVFNLAERRVQYYGDHKVDSPGPPVSTRGNAALLKAFEAHNSDDPMTRATAVPLVIFRSVEQNGQSKGYLEFCGLGVIKEANLVDQRDPGTGRRFQNFLFDIALLDLTPEGNQLDWGWINARRDSQVTNQEANNMAPVSWQSWIRTAETGPVDLDGETARAPAWTRDELILACALVCRNRWHEVRKNDLRALELSDLLQLLPVHPHAVRGPKFRSPSSVQRKTADLASAHPDYGGVTTRGGQLTKQIVAEFIERPGEMLSAADQIKSAITSTDPDVLNAIATREQDEIEEATAVEGRVLQRMHRFRERNARLRKQKIDSVRRGGGALACQVCGFDFAQRFGSHGEGYIEVHHVLPLHETGTAETRLSDLALVCANCHRMSHRRLARTGTWPSPEELREVMRRDA